MARYPARAFAWCGRGAAAGSSSPSPIVRAAAARRRRWAAGAVVAAERSESGVQPFNRSPLTRAPAGDDKKDNENDPPPLSTASWQLSARSLAMTMTTRMSATSAARVLRHQVIHLDTARAAGDAPTWRRDEKSPGGSPFGSRTLGWGSNDRQQDERGTSNPFGSRTLGGNDRSAERGQEDKSASAG